MRAAPLAAAFFVISIAPLAAGDFGRDYARDWGGDFGRVRRFFQSDTMHAWVGAEAVISRGGRASDFELTDRETLLRDLAYPLIEPPKSRPWWKSVFGEYKPLPAPWRQEVRFDVTYYGRLLIDEPHRSHASRYQQLADDIRSDLLRFDPFFAAADSVIDMDRRRAKALTLIAAVSPREEADARARIDENVAIVAWVKIAMRQRAAAYRFALERLVLHAPDEAAANVDRLLAELDRRLAAFGSVAFASSPPRSAVVRKD